MEPEPTTESTSGSDDASVAGPADADRAGPVAPSRTERLRRKAVDLSERTGEQIEHQRKKFLPVDLAVQFYERDRESLASVLGSAAALRLYLFMIPAMMVLVGLLIILVGKDQLDSMLSSAGITGTMASDISAAADGSTGTGLVLIISGFWLLLWAGRSFTKVLAASAGRSWRLDPKHAKATMTAMGAVTGLLIVLFSCTLLLNRIRDRHGLAADTTSWMLTLALISLAWFTVTWFLPRETPDPGALLPGAAFVGVTLTILQWFMQFYLPSKISRSSDVVGQLGISMAALGYLFLIGRLMVSSFVVNAILFERLGSLSRLLFALPLIRAIPRRYPKVAEFFDLPDFLPPEGAPEATTAPDPVDDAMM